MDDGGERASEQKLLFDERGALLEEAGGRAGGGLQTGGTDVPQSDLSVSAQREREQRT